MLSKPHCFQMNQIPSPMSKSPMSSPEMDAGIWSNLPEELLERILSMLPLKTFMVLRSTCKHFKSLLFSPTFISKHSSSNSSPFSSFLMLSHPQCYPHFPLYDSPLGAWRNFALSLSELLPCAAGPVSLLSISNGLLCFSLPSSSSFVVCNFLTKSSRVIEYPTYPFHFELLTLVSTPVGYNIFMLSSESSTKTRTIVYDSKVQSWQNLISLDTILSDNHHQEGVHFNGSLYFSTPEPFSIVNFNLESGKWERHNTELPGELVFVRLVSDEGKGKMYLIGGIGGNGISRRMKIWELCEGKNWVEIESVPEMMCRKIMSVCYHNYEYLYCFWHQGLICVCCYAWPEILYYKVSRRTWHWLHKSPSVPERWACGFRWFSFVPELYASV
ncbi:F-box/kelch-repeat protein [Rosa sericea]